MAFGKRIIFLLVALNTVACSVGGDEFAKAPAAAFDNVAREIQEAGAAAGPTTDIAAKEAPSTETPAGNAAVGKTLFSSEELGCVNCHQIEGTQTGHPGIPLPGGQNSQRELRNKINDSMPPGDKNRCSNSCADDVAQFIWETINPQSKALKSLHITTSTVIYQEAESLQGSTGYALNHAWLLNGDGFVSAVADFPEPGHYQLAVRAWGDQGGDNPVSMTFNLDGLEVKSFPVKETGDNPGLFIADVDIQATGPKIVEIWFTNDLYLPAEGIDRNLYVDWLVVSGPNQVMASLSHIPVLRDISTSYASSLSPLHGLRDISTSYASLR